MSVQSIVAEMSGIDLFARNADHQPTTGEFVGNPFSLDYDRARLLVADSWKMKAKGLPQGSFLLAYYDNQHKEEKWVNEAILLRVLGPTSLPTDSEVISSMVEFHKESLKKEGRRPNIDDYTRHEFSFSGVECRVLGTFYKDKEGNVCFGADVENFFSAHHYRVLKPNSNVLKRLVNFRSKEVTGSSQDIPLGRVRYSSSRRYQETEDLVPVYVTPRDFLGKRTAMFGMTRTGKSNSVKMIIKATVEMSDKAEHTKLPPNRKSSDGPLTVDEMNPFTSEGTPRFPVGQMIFDINGEYANANQQDQGTAIFEIYKDRVERYSVIAKPGFNVMKVNFYQDVASGFELVRAYLAEETGDYVKSFLSADLDAPEDPQDRSATTRHERRVAVYQSILHQAGFALPKGQKIKFPGAAELNTLAGGVDPSAGITPDQAVNWWTTIWENYDTDNFFADYKRKKGREWADDDLKALLVMLTRKRQPRGNANVSGYIKLRAIRDQHTEKSDAPFEVAIVEQLRAGRIVIADLSQGDPVLQRMFSERICRKVFQDAMNRFIHSDYNNYIQFYFEEAHNLFPKKEDKDLSQIYNRLAKEGAKLQLGMTYATQEVSSISSNILKNTQNWFIAHLNNEDETRELRKYYDFGDFTEGLVRFSASSDQGFVRMKTYSNAFVVPVQIKLFEA